jgi:hypothetical protein
MLSLLVKPGRRPPCAGTRKLWTIETPDILMTAPEQISIRTERAGVGLIKIVWSDSSGARFPPYRVYTNWLSAKAVEVRLALEQVRAAYLHPRPNFTEAIATLADRGRDLRVALFEDCPPEDRNAAYEPLAWFEDLIRSGTNSVMITVHADPILPIPWGLLHEYGVVAGGGDPCDAFWALRHKITAL